MPDDRAHDGSALDKVFRVFQESAYLAANPDVAAAVPGLFSSGWAHFDACGLNEGRSLGLPTRRDRMLNGLRPAAMRGVELGPLMTPVVHKHEGSILYIDHADTATIRKKYGKDPNVDVSRIVEVDAVWSSGALRDALPPGFRADYVLASHVVEHVPDLIVWLADLEAILSQGGQVRLAVPDRRYTFDLLRRETQLHEILDAHLHRATVPTPHVVLDHCLNFRTVDLRDAWLGRLDVPRLKGMFTVEQAMAAARKAMNEGSYLDVHCWVFTPASFAALMEQATGAGLIRFECSDYHFTQPFENDFMVGMRPNSNPASAARSWRLMREAAVAWDL